MPHGAESFLKGLMFHVCLPPLLTISATSHMLLRQIDSMAHAVKLARLPHIHSAPEEGSHLQDQIFSSSHHESLICMLPSNFETF